MTTPITPIWRHWSLKDHHKKHCADSPTCFQEVLGFTVQVSQQDYEKASEEAFKKAYIRYDAQEANRQDGGFYPARHYRLDGRSLKTIADLESASPRYFRSCFHVHYGKPHSSADLQKSELDQVMRYLEKLEDDRDQNMISKTKIQGADGSDALTLRNKMLLASEINRLNKKM